MSEKILHLFSILKTNKIKVLIFTAIFFAVNMYLITQEFYLFSLFPLVLFFAYLFLTSLDFVFFTAVALTPLSFELFFEDFNLGLNLPSELFFFGILVLFFFKLLLENPLKRTFTKQTVSVLIFAHLLWMFITSLTSSLPVVSFKYLLMQMWFIVPVYYFGSLLLHDKKKIYIFLLLLIVSITITVIYTTINHSMHGFAEKSGNWVMQPFYNDHTAYGAILALILPVSLGISFKSNFSKTVRFFIFLCSILIITGIFLSFSRATWMSVAVALTFFLILVYRIRFRYIFIALTCLIGLFFLNEDSILLKLEKNRQDSSEHFIEHVRSITNISTDASNLERINRWKSAVRMFEDYPVFGTGSGTYQFLYAPYQKSNDRTIISTNAGDLGNAHSEYLTPLCERGILGLIIFISIVISVFYLGIKTFQKSQDKEIKMITATILTGLFSYMIHGFLNNFLDKDYASVIFWGYICIIVSLYIKVKYKNSIQE